MNNLWNSIYAAKKFRKTQKQNKTKTSELQYIYLKFLENEFISAIRIIFLTIQFFLHLSFVLSQLKGNCELLSHSSDVVYENGLFASFFKHCGLKTRDFK